MKHCCIHCFNDDYLKKQIKDRGSPGECNFCGRRSRYCIEPSELAGLFMPVISLYSIWEDFMPLHQLKNSEGEFIWEKLDQDWNVFSCLNYSKQEDLIRSMFRASSRYDKGEDPIVNSWVDRKDEYFGTDYEYSDSLKKMWDEFCDEIMHKNRFFPHRDMKPEFLNELLPIVSCMIEKKRVFCRARISEDRKPHPRSKMGKPPEHKSRDGRANPKGIPYLYLASDPITAISEVRATVGDTVTLGTFRLTEKLNVIDLTNVSIDSPFRHEFELEFYLKHLGFLRVLGDELSKAINPDRDDLRYVPLQYLCELIKNSGFDGIVFRSSVAKGSNLAVFNDKKVRCVLTEQYMVEKVELTARKIEDLSD